MPQLVSHDKYPLHTLTTKNYVPIVRLINKGYSNPSTGPFSWCFKGKPTESQSLTSEKSKYNFLLEYLKYTTTGKSTHWFSMNLHYCRRNNMGVPGVLTCVNNEKSDIWISEVMCIISLCYALDNCMHEKNIQFSINSLTNFSWTKIINKGIANPLAIIFSYLLDNTATTDFFVSDH